MPIEVMFTGPYEQRTFDKELDDLLDDVNRLAHPKRYCFDIQCHSEKMLFSEPLRWKYVSLYYEYMPNSWQALCHVENVLKDKSLVYYLLGLYNGLNEGMKKCSTQA